MLTLRAFIVGAATLFAAAALGQVAPVQRFEVKRRVTAVSGPMRWNRGYMVQLRCGHVDIWKQPPNRGSVVCCFTCTAQAKERVEHPNRWPAGRAMEDRMNRIPMSERGAFHEGTCIYHPRERRWKGL